MGSNGTIPNKQDIDVFYVDASAQTGNGAGCGACGACGACGVNQCGACEWRCGSRTGGRVSKQIKANATIPPLQLSFLQFHSHDRSKMLSPTFMGKISFMMCAFVV